MEAEPGMGCDTGGMWHRHDGIVQSTPEVFFNSESNWGTEGDLRGKTSLSLVA